MGTIVKRLIRTDAAGYYVEYTYADGHVETQPPGRPLSKEDVQRQVRQQRALANATKTLQAEATMASFGETDLTPSQARSRAVFDQTNGADATADFARAVDAISTIAQTASVRPAESADVVNNVSLGGPAANETSEFTTLDTPVDPDRVSAFSAVARRVVTATREIDNG